MTARVNFFAPFTFVDVVTAAPVKNGFKNGSRRTTKVIKTLEKSMKLDKKSLKSV